MKGFRRFAGLVALAILAFAFQNCATVFGGRTNTLVFKGDSLSTALVYIDGELVGEAPGKIKLTKDKIQHGSKLEVKADGQDTQEYTLIRKIHPWYTVADFFTFGIGLAIDYGTGNLYRPIPRSFTITPEESE